MAVASGRPHPASRPGDEIYLAGVEYMSYLVENLAAGADLTERVMGRCKYPTEFLECEILPTVASVGVDGSNTLLVTLRNITGAVDIATVTLTTNLVLNTPVALTMSTTLANRIAAADDVIGLVVTQGATADTAGFILQATNRCATV